MHTHTHPLTRTLTAGLWLTAGTLAVGLVISAYASPATPAPVAPATYTVPLDYPGTPAALVNALTTPCTVEDGRDCMWSASTLGNGEGCSFVDVAGVAYYWDYRCAEKGN